MGSARIPAHPPAWKHLTEAQRSIVLCLRRQGPQTREQLAQRLGWTASTLSREVSPMIAHGSLLSDPPGTRRRNAVLLPARSLGCAVGIEIGFSVVRAALVDFAGHPILAPREYRPERREPAAFIRCVDKAVRELQARAGGRELLGIGIGYADRSSWNPAQVFSARRAAEPADPLVKAIADRFELPVQSRCDAACAALGEWRHGRLRGTETALFLLYSEGIGLGVIGQGGVVFGHWDDAGEIGHIPIDDEGEYCHCGNTGCLETIAAKWALEKRIRQIIETRGPLGFQRPPKERAPGVDDLCRMAATGDLLARNMLLKAGRALGRALAISASLLDPAAIVLGGALADAELYAPLIAATQQAFQTLTTHRTPQPIRFETSALGDDATVIGAAELIFSELA